MSVCLSVCSHLERRIPVDWRLLVKERFANIRFQNVFRKKICLEFFWFVGLYEPDYQENGLWLGLLALVTGDRVTDDAVPMTRYACNMTHET